VVAALAAVPALVAAAGCTAASGGSVGAASTPAPSPTVSASSAGPAATSGATSGVTSGAAGALRFSVLGDVGADEHASAALQAIGSRHDDFSLVVGDLSYGHPGQESRWCRFVADRVGPDHPVELVAGNHDDDGPNGVIQAFTACLPNRLPGLVGDYGRQWYADVPVDHPLVRVVMISPALDFGQGDWSYAEGTDHYAWTRAAVSGAREAGIPWVVVGMHKPCLSVGIYHCDPGADLMNLLLQERVDLVVAGHEHMYQRTHALALGPGCPAVHPGRYDAACVTTGPGTTFVTVGTGGHDLRDMDPGDAELPYFAAVSAANRDPAWGSLAVEVTPSRLTARFEAVEGASFTDAVTLTK
jgi:hypothetical protein